MPSSFVNINTSGRQGIEDPSQSRWRGIALPFNRQPKGFFEPKGTRDVIWSSIVNILLTPLGTRIHLPEFGSRLPELLFEPNDDLLMALSRSYIQDAIAKWEPRVRIIRSDVFRDTFNEYRLHVSLAYEVVQEGIEENRSLLVSRSSTLAVESIA